MTRTPVFTLAISVDITSRKLAAKDGSNARSVEQQSTMARAQRRLSILYISSEDK